ncbi:MAG: hypothetical protein JRF57_11015 [Deltaproteobacteria bacterium]|nr:hypothetical protein [Deltaproteobacteria bacterium]MBW2304229.1 hypothetical protein [Deltaproteobacteria bacterium]
MCGFLVMACVFTCSRPSRAITGNSDEGFGLDGSLRIIGALFRNRDGSSGPGAEKYDEYMQAVLRLAAAGRPREDLFYEIHLVQSLTYFSGGKGQGGNIDLTGGNTRYRALDEASKWWTRKDAETLLWLDRFNLKMAFPVMDVTIGRQAVTFGKAHFWNPLDVYLPFAPAQFDRDYKAGVDALRLDFPLGDFSGITLVGVLGREIDSSGHYAHEERRFHADWYGSSLLARFFTNLGGWDLAFQGGKIYGGYQVGGAFTGEIKGVEVRGEAAYFRGSESPALNYPLKGDLFEDRLTAVIGLGKRFPNSLVLDAEYLFNGGGESNLSRSAVARFRQGAIPHLGRHLAGFMASYEFTPLLVGQFSLIYSFSDHSCQFQPNLTLSLSDDSDLIMGASVNVGKVPEVSDLGVSEPRSEFGSYPHMVFMELKVYF